MRNLNKKSKCRLTGRSVGLYMIGAEDVPEAWRTVTGWIYIDISPEDGLRERQDTKFYPDPVDFCWRQTSEGDRCVSKIRPENARAQLWACGRHMARFQEEEERKTRNDDMRRINAQKEELFEWELSEAIRVYETLKELGWSSVLPPTAPRKTWGTSLRDTDINIGQAEFLALVSPPEEEEEEYDDEFTAVSEDFFASDL